MEKMKKELVIEDTEHRQKALQEGPLEHVFPGSTSKILDFLCVFDEWDYSITDIAKNSGISFKTAFDEIKRLRMQEVVINSRTVGKAKMYKLNLESPQGKSIHRLALDIAVKRATRQAH
ncbi:MAG: hypothetical protein HW420_1024 [Candidatus Nitrosotenuis sp.]|nr:hypothetical protein [Candidatus Nitrosotenuis sp.]